MYINFILNMEYNKIMYMSLVEIFHIIKQYHNVVNNLNNMHILT